MYAISSYKINLTIYMYKTVCSHAKHFSKEFQVILLVLEMFYLLDAHSLCELLELLRSKHLHIETFS